MEQKDPKDMTASELVRWVENYTDIMCRACREMGFGCDAAEVGDCEKALDFIADKIDAELAQARRSGLERAAKSWAETNSWPAFRDGEDFGAWLERCAIKRPCYEDGEPVRASREWNAIMMSLDGSRFKLLENYPDGLCFAGSPVKRPDPDTQERIDEDAVKGSNDYWGCHGYECLQCPSLLDGENPCERYSTRTDCRKAMTLDLLRRQRELDKRTGGAE